MCMCLCICIVSVCGVPHINLVSLVYLPMSQKAQNVKILKIHNSKNIINRYINFFPIGSPQYKCITVPNIKALSLTM